MKDPAAPHTSGKAPVLPAPRKLGTGPGALQQDRNRLASILLVAAIVAVALNQRPAVVAVAPILGELRADTGLSSTLAGLLTTLPVLCFGAFAPVAPRLARRIGLETAVALSLLLLAAGIALRLLPRWRCCSPAASSPVPPSPSRTCCCRPTSSASTTVPAR